MIDWVALSARIAETLERMPTTNRSLRMPLDELLAMTGETVEPRNFRDRGTWAAIQRGGRDWDTTRRAGLVVNFEPDETGRRVEYVTFRIDQFSRP